jgi:hypothetical protein
MEIRMKKMAKGPRRSAWTRVQGKGLAALSWTVATRARRWGAALAALSVWGLGLGWGGQALGVRAHQGMCSMGWALDCSARALAWTPVDGMTERQWKLALGEPFARPRPEDGPFDRDEPAVLMTPQDVEALAEQALVDKLRARHAHSVAAGAEGFALYPKDVEGLRELLRRRASQAQTSWEQARPLALAALGERPAPLDSAGVEELIKAGARFKAASDGLSQLAKTSRVIDSEAARLQAFEAGRAWSGVNAKSKQLWAQQQERGRGFMAGGFFASLAFVALLGGLGKAGWNASRRRRREAAAKRFLKDGVQRWGSTPVSRQAKAGDGKSDTLA